MLTWLAANLGTTLITLLLAAIVTAIILRLIHAKKQGKHSCCGDCKTCGHCTHSAGCAACHPKTSGIEK